MGGKKNGFSPPYDKAQLVSWALLTIMICTFHGVLSTFLRDELSLTIVHWIGAIGILLSALITTATDPKENGVSKSSTEFANAFCHVCQVYVPNPSRHCRVCDKCVSRFDHHCIWLNNCVGGHNYRSFLHLVFHVSWYLLYIGISCLDFVVIKLGIFNGILLNENESTGEMKFWQVLVVGVVAIIAFTVCYMSSVLFMFHLKLISRGITTYEFIIITQQTETGLTPFPSIYKSIGRISKAFFGFKISCGCFGCSRHPQVHTFASSSIDVFPSSSSTLANANNNKDNNNNSNNNKDNTLLESGSYIHSAPAVGGLNVGGEKTGGSMPSIPHLGTGSQVIESPTRRYSYSQSNNGDIDALERRKKKQSFTHSRLHSPSNKSIISPSESHYHQQQEQNNNDTNKNHISTSSPLKSTHKSSTSKDPETSNLPQLPKFQLPTSDGEDDEESNSEIVYIGTPIQILDSEQTKQQQEQQHQSNKSHDDDTNKNDVEEIASVLLGKEGGLTTIDSSDDLSHLENNDEAPSKMGFKREIVENDEPSLVSVSTPVLSPSSSPIPQKSFSLSTSMVTPKETSSSPKEHLPNAPAAEIIPLSPESKSYSQKKASSLSPAQKLEPIPITNGTCQKMSKLFSSDQLPVDSKEFTVDGTNQSHSLPIIPPLPQKTVLRGLSMRSSLPNTDIHDSKVNSPKTEIKKTVSPIAPVRKLPALSSSIILEESKEVGTGSIL